jgi:hypothetical protein
MSLKRLTRVTQSTDPFVKAAAARPGFTHGLRKCEKNLTVEGVLTSSKASIQKSANVHQSVDGAGLRSALKYPLSIGGSPTE